MKRILLLVCVFGFLVGCATTWHTVRTSNEETSPFYKIIDMLEDGKKVRLVILIGDITIANRISRMEFEQWRGMVKNSLLNRYEQKYLEITDNNFRLVDRYKVDEILKELHFQAVGMVPADMRLKIGEITGATHILYVSLSRTIEDDFFTWKLRSRYVPSDTTYERLISVQTGDVVGSFSSTEQAD